MCIYLMNKNESLTIKYWYICRVETGYCDGIEINRCGLFVYFINRKVKVWTVYSRTFFNLYILTKLIFNSFHPRFTFAVSVIFARNFSSMERTATQSSLKSKCAHVWGPPPQGLLIKRERERERHGGRGGGRVQINPGNENTMKL